MINNGDKYYLQVRVVSAEIRLTVGKTIGVNGNNMNILVLRLLSLFMKAVLWIRGGIYLGARTELMTIDSSALTEDWLVPFVSSIKDNFVVIYLTFESNAHQ